MSELCRICLVNNKELLQLLEINTNESEMEISDCGYMFEECLDIKLLSNDEHNKICMDCNIQLKYFYDFKKKALQANECLKSQMLFTVEVELDESEDIHNLNIKSLESNDIENNAEILNQYEAEVDHEIESVSACEDKNYTDFNGNDDEDENCVIEYLESVDDNEDNTTEFIDIIEDEQSLDNQILHTNENKQCYNLPHLAKKIDFNIEESEEYHNSLNFNNNELKTVKNSIENLNSKTKKSKQNKLICHICKKLFRSDKTYSAHLNFHKGLLPWVCEICGKGFAFRVSYSYHQKRHANIRSHICTVCSKRFICKWDLKIHERLHTNTNPFACNICGKSFRIQSHWKNHLETHNETNQYECTQCHQKYKTKASLRSHITSIHSNIRYICNLCHKSFNRRHHLLTHTRIHTSKLDKIMENETKS